MQEGIQHLDNDERFDDEAPAPASNGVEAAARGDDSYGTESIDPITPAEERLFSSRPSRPLGDGCWVSVPIYSD